jgi:predicted metal-dependent HD superfamily phosphohydrolase
MLQLEARWRQTWARLEAPAPPGLFRQLLAAYGEAHRAYHTTAHLSHCFDQLDSCGIQAEDPASLELALWFHDAIYDTKAGDNEARSAAWAVSALGFLDAARLQRIERLILVTQHEAAPEGADQQLLLDVDLSILGAPASRFAEYELEVRREYQWVPEDAYRKARARILEQFQARLALYHTAHFRDALETRARENLRRSLEALSG